MMQSVNLYTQDLRPRRDVLTLTHTALAGAAVLLMVLLSALYTDWRADQAVAAQQSLQAQIPQLQAAVKTAEESLSQRRADTALAADVDRLSRALVNRERLLAWMQQFARTGAEGFSPYLAGLARQAVNGVWLTGLEVDRETGAMALTGLTRDGGLVPFYLEQLRSEPAFAGRRFRHFELDRSVEDSSVLRFRVASHAGEQEARK